MKEWSMEMVEHGCQWWVEPEVKRCERGRALHLFVKSFCTIWVFIMCVTNLLGKKVMGGKFVRIAHSDVIWLPVASKDVRSGFGPPSPSPFLFNLKWDILQPICLLKMMF